MSDKKFKDTKIGSFLLKTAPTILDTVGDVFPPAKVLSSLIDSEPTICEEDRVKAQKIIQDSYETELKFSLENTKSARKNYDKSKDMSDWMSKVILRWNHLLMILLTIINILVVRHLDSTLIAIISQMIGMIVQQLASERSTVVNFYLGSAAKSNNKEDGLK